MKKSIVFLVAALLFFTDCAEDKKTIEAVEVESDSDLSAIVTKDFREFKVLDSKYLKNEVIWKDLEETLLNFSEKQYNAIKPLVLEQNIPTIQNHIRNGELTYEGLVLFYLYRIKNFDRENELSLNAVISINPEAVKLARMADEKAKSSGTRHQIFGMPVLLKDNINAGGMPTTAGAIALSKNEAQDAFIVKKLKDNGAIILGKANLSEWAYFFCGDCPSGYSAVGGQTLNPYGRRVIDTGGSSSGSGVAVAANFCVAAVGSETAGSILSPASQNAVVGLKPTVGLLSRSGIVPISSTLDTPGPMAKNVTDTAIVLDAMTGYDAKDSKAIQKESRYTNYNKADLKGKRFGVYKRLLEDTLYVNAIAVLKTQGVSIVEIEEPEIALPEFIRLLNLDMKKDLKVYLSDFANSTLEVKSVEDVINYNLKDSLFRAPYGQKLFKGVEEDKSSDSAFVMLKNTLKTNGRQFFNIPIQSNQLDGFLSINNYHAAFAAVAEYPAITVPMGFTNTGVLKGLTFIALPFKESDLLNWAYVYEQASKARVAPANYN